MNLFITTFRCKTTQIIVQHELKHKFLIIKYYLIFSLSGLSLNGNWHKQHSNDSTINECNYDDTLVGEDDVFMVSY
jgi:hypothetical protein